MATFAKIKMMSEDVNSLLLTGKFKANGQLARVEDGAIVCARNAEGLLREEAAVGERGHCVAVLLQNLAERRVLMLRRHDYHVVVVLGGGADKRDAAYVDFLYDVGF